MNFLFVLILLSPLIIPLLLGWWALSGGRVGSWVAAGLLVWVVLWEGKVFIGRTYPRLLYSPEERGYMDKLVGAIQTGKTQVPLRELAPFKWSVVCFVEVDSRGPWPPNREEVTRMMGGEVDWWTGWHLFEVFDTDYQALLAYFKTPIGVVRFEDKGWIFTSYGQSFWKNRYYKEKLKRVGYEVEWGVLESHNLRGHVCYRPEEVIMNIRREKKSM